MTPEALRHLTKLAMATRLADHPDSVAAAASKADSASQMALALGALEPRGSVLYFDLISNATKYRQAELRAATLAPRAWTKEAR